MARLESTFARIATLSGRPVYSLKRFATTVHPIGGARIDDNPERGVVDGRGEAHGLPGLFVVDAAALPGPLGSAPSMTIAAWASHVAARIGDRSPVARQSRITEAVA
jgi:cholesterol oxidase